MFFVSFFCCSPREENKNLILFNFYTWMHFFSLFTLFLTIYFAWKKYFFKKIYFNEIAHRSITSITRCILILGRCGANNTKPWPKVAQRPGEQKQKTRKTNVAKDKTGESERERAKNTTGSCTGCCETILATMLPNNCNTEKKTHTHRIHTGCAHTHIRWTTASEMQ